MANSNSKINVQVGFSVDKSGLSEMQSLFQQIANRAAEPGNKMKTGLQEAAKTATTLDNILSKTFNSDLGSLNVTKFNQELSKSGLTLKDVKSQLSQAGNQGVTAFNRLSQAILGTNQQLKQSSKALDQMFTTFKNTIRYGISSSVFNNMANSIQKAFDYSKQLDTSLNDIRIVTDKSADSMAEFAKQANEAAKGMGASTLDYTNAALIYYQQGLSDAEVQARAETTIKAANVTGQTGEEVSEQLTAVWNGYKVTAEETELYVDKLAAVAATTAADLEELSTGMSKVASAANAMGVDFDDLNAQIATIVSVTRQAPESVGTALKTIYARLGDLKVDGIDEFGVSLGEVSEQMQTMGIQILNQNGDLRDMSSVIAEVAEKWGTWTQAQRQAAAVAMAGKRQYNNLIALFDNWDMYTNALNTSTEAMGTLQHQQDIYMESTAAKLKTLKAAWQGLYDDAINEDEINAGIEALTNLVEVFDNFIDSFGGGIKSIAGFGAILSSVFNKQISDSVINATNRFNIFKNNLDIARTKAQTFNLGTEQVEGATSQQVGVSVATEKELEIAQRIYEVRKGLNEEQGQALVGLQKEVTELTEEETVLRTITERQAEKVLGTKETSEYMEAELSKAEEINASYGTRVDDLNKILAAEEQIQEILDLESPTYQNAKIARDEIVRLAKDINIQDREDFEKLVKQKTSMDELFKSRAHILKVIKDSTQGVEEELEKAEEQAIVAEQVYQNKRKIYDIDEKIKNKEIEINDAIEKAQLGTNIYTQVTTITSALGNLAMAWSSVSSLMDTWNNNETEFGDKIVQTLMTLGMTIPLVISNFSKLNDTLGLSLTTTLAETAAVEGLNIADTQLILTEQAKAAITEANNLKQEYWLYLVQRGVAQTTLLKQAEELETAAKLKNQLAEELQILTSKGNLLAKAKLTIQILLHKTALDADTMSEYANIQAKLYSKAVTLALTAAIVAAVAVIAIIIKSIQKWHETQIKQAKSTLEQVKANQELVDSNKELYDSYNQLLKVYNENGENKEELYDKTLELAEAYGIEDARVLALADDYVELTRRINEARKAELSSNIRDAEKGMKAAASGAAHEMTSGRGWIHGNIYDFSTGAQGANEVAQMEETVKAVGLEANMFKHGVNEATFSMQIDYSDPKAVKEWLDQVNDMVEYMETAYSQAELSHNAFYQQIKKDQEDSAEFYKDLSEQLNALYSSKVELAFFDVNLDTVKNAEDLQNIITQITEQLQGQIPEEELNKYINDYLKGIDSISDSLDKINIAKKIAKQTDKELNDILSQIKNFNSNQLAYLELHLNTAILNDDLNTWIQDNAPYISLLAKQSSAENFKSLLTNYNEDEGFSSEQLSGIYENEAMADFMSVSEQEISVMDSGQQLDALTKAWIENTQYVVENRKEILDTLTTEEKELANTTQSKIDAAKKEEDTLKSLIQNSEKYKNDQIELINIIKKLGSEGYDELEPSQKALLNGFSEEVGIQKEVLSMYGETISEAEYYEASLSDIRKRIQDVSEAELNYAEILDQVNQNISIHNSIIDSIQDAYKSLINIVDSYNETGAFTIDTVQQLMTMSDKYVAQLQFEGNQLSLNESGFQALTLAKLDDLAADAELEYQLKMTELAQIAEANANDAAAQKEALHAQQLAVLGDVAEETASKVMDLAVAMAAIDAYGSDDVKAAADQATKAYQNRLKAIENARANISKGGSSMRSAMGASSKSKSSGSSKDKEEKELKKLEDELDRYHDINRALDQMERALKKVDKQQEKLYGKELIRSLKQENELLENQAGLYEQLYAAQQQEAAELRGQLSGMGVAFDESSGAITNYAQAVAQALATYNAAVTAYNNGPQDEAAKKSLEAAEKAYENFKKLIERYDTLYYKEMQDTQEKLEEIWRKRLENNLKAWEVEIQLKLDWKQLERDWNDFLHEVTKDFKKVFSDLRVEVKNMFKDAQTYIGDEGTINTIIDAVHDVTGEIDKLMGGGESDMFESVSQAQEKLKELNEQLLDSSKALHDLWKEAWDNYLDGIDQVKDSFDDLIDRFERIDEELEFQGKLIELLYGEEAYKLLSKLYEGQQKSAETQLSSLKQQVDMWKQLFEESGATMDNQMDWTADQQKYYENWIDLQSQLNDKIIEYIELIKKDYLNSVSDVLKQLEKYITGGSGLDDIATEWERISADADKYYDSVEGAYYIQTLANKIDESIAKANNLKAQQKLMKLREKEIDYLREKENLTEYDIKAAELRYQIALKEIALQDAQQNKTGMKLTRNEQGNWSYQYVADEEDVATKRQELLDAYNSLYQLASDAYEANLEALQELQEKYLESAKAIYEDDNLSNEEREQKLFELREEYFEKYGELAAENQLYRDDLATAGAALLLSIYNQDKDAYESMTDTEKELVDALVSANISDYQELDDAVKGNYKDINDSAKEAYQDISAKSKEVMQETRADWTSKAQELADLWNKDGGGSVKSEVVKAYDSIEDANKKYQEAVDRCAEIVERDFSEEGIAGAIQDAENEVDNLRDKTAEMVETAKPYLTELKEYVNMIEQAWLSVQQAIMDAISLIEEYLRKVGEANAAAQQQAAAQQAAAEATKQATQTKNTESKTRNLSNNATVTSYTDPYGVSGTRMNTSSDGTQWISYVGNDSSTLKYTTLPNSSNSIHGGSSGSLDDLKKHGGSSGHFATGGYTGEWGDTSGKLAVLHQKELVLNADDTANFLSAVNTIRDLNSGLNHSIQDAVLNAVARTALNVGGLNTSALGGLTNNNSNTDNTYNITAEFPNAANVNEIREAILSLPNIASQYANSTLK